ncbi:hypothetical protein [Streptomyces xinghaiensis]|uniref:hypothetical protein n=1 Tax=Streptomyces xinghaiensis TaxID=1038928 RepID=UPI0002E53949|nr:hypothetical protein [Streptomyces xinghaiensis]
MNRDTIRVHAWCTTTTVAADPGAATGQGLRGLIHWWRAHRAHPGDGHGRPSAPPGRTQTKSNALQTGVAVHHVSPEATP